MSKTVMGADIDTSDYSVVSIDDDVSPVSVSDANGGAYV